MKPTDESHVQPPETLEGWYSLHQIFTIDRSARVASRPQAADIVSRVESTQATGDTASDGWSAWVRLIGSRSDVMAIHFAPTLDAIGEVQNRTSRLAAATPLRLDYSFLSITEAGLYHMTAELARETAERGGQVGDEKYTAELALRVAKERDNPYVQRRLFPPLPERMPYVSFYPMSKRRSVGQNWYGLSLDERSRLMYTHGKTGRRYAGKVVQIITGAIGFDAWEWGVTLFAADPLEFKKLVTDMRFDEVSAHYAEFGDFYVGRLMSETDVLQLAETL